MYYALFEKKKKQKDSVILNILKCFRKLSMLLKEAWAFFKKEEKKKQKQKTDKQIWFYLHSQTSESIL